MLNLVNPITTTSVNWLSMLQIIYTAIRRSISIVQITLFVFGIVLKQILDRPLSLFKRLRVSPPNTGDHEAQAPGAYSKKVKETHSSESSPTKKETHKTPKRNSNGIAKTPKGGREISQRPHAEDDRQGEEVNANLVETESSEVVIPNENIAGENFQYEQPRNMGHVSPTRRKVNCATRFGSNTCIPPQSSASAGGSCIPPGTAASSIQQARTILNKTPPSFWTPAPQVQVTITAPKAASRNRRHKRNLNKLLTENTRPNLNREASRFSGPLQALDMNKEDNH